MCSIINIHTDTQRLKLNELVIAIFSTMDAGNKKTPSKRIDVNGVTVAPVSPISGSDMDEGSTAAGDTCWEEAADGDRVTAAPSRAAGSERGCAGQCSWVLGMGVQQPAHLPTNTGSQAAPSP